MVQPQRGGTGLNHLGKEKITRKPLTDNHVMGGGGETNPQDREH